MKPWAHVDLHWSEVTSLSVKLKRGGNRSIILNGVEYEADRIKESAKDKKIIGMRLHFFGLDFVIKVDVPSLYERGAMIGTTRQSNHEYKIWNSLEESDRKHFAKVIAYEKNRYIVFHRYPEIVSDKKYNITRKHVDLVHHFTKKYNLCDLSNYMTSRPHNWVLLNGQVLIYDYGFDHHDGR
jgi:hypothetical protein